MEKGVASHGGVFKAVALHAVRRLSRIGRLADAGKCGD
jgi:hypothetical protein